jgi:hypothetical protein
LSHEAVAAAAAAILCAQAQAAADDAAACHSRAVLWSVLSVRGGLTWAVMTWGWSGTWEPAVHTAAADGATTPEGAAGGLLPAVAAAAAACPHRRRRLRSLPRHGRAPWGVSSHVGPAVHTAADGATPPVPQEACCCSDVAVPLCARPLCCRRVCHQKRPAARWLAHEWRAWLSGAKGDGGSADAAAP